MFEGQSLLSGRGRGGGGIALVALFEGVQFESLDLAIDSQRSSTGEAETGCV